MTKKNKILISVIGAFIVLGVVVYSYYFVYGRNAMVIDILQAKEYLWRARGSINLQEMADYMIKAKDALEARTGNPNWLFHLVDTDFDLIKHDLEKNIEVTLNISASEPMGSYGYQRAVDNVQEVCIELNSHLDVAVTWSTDWLPITLLLNGIAWTVFLVLIGYFIVVNRKKFVIRTTTITFSRTKDSPNKK